MATSKAHATIEQAHREGRPGTPEDSLFMVTQIATMRRVIFPDQSIDEQERVALWLICFIAPAKSSTYRDAVLNLCERFAGIAERVDLQLHFINALRPAALYVQPSDDASIQDPSLYFDASVIFPPSPLSLGGELTAGIDPERLRRRGQT